MKELLKKSWSWTLYDNDGKLILCVLCGDIGLYEVGYILDKDEANRVNLEGENFVQELAILIMNDPQSVPDGKKWKC